MKIVLVSLCIICLTGCRELGYAMQGMGEGMVMSSQQMYMMQQQQMQQQMMQNGNSGGGAMQGNQPSGQMQGIKCPRCGDTYYGQFTCPRCSAPKY